jgi:Dienelactone hydrolase and related enzymes
VPPDAAILKKGKSMSAKEIEIHHADASRFTGYLAVPAPGRNLGAGILLLQEIYGTNPDIRGLADQYAEAGFTVLAPDVFFWRKAPNLVFAYAEKEAARAAFVEIGGEAQVSADIPLALGWLRQHLGSSARIGLLGFGIGAILGFKGVANGDLKVAAAAAFFPARLALASAAAIDQPWLFHFPEHDAVAEAGLERKTRDAFAGNDRIRIEHYPSTGHGFAIPGRPEYDAASARRAYGRTVDFFTDTLSAGRH